MDMLLFLCIYAPLPSTLRVKYEQKSLREPNDRIFDLISIQPFTLSVSPLQSTLSTTLHTTSSVPRRSPRLSFVSLARSTRFQLLHLPSRFSQCQRLQSLVSIRSNFEKQLCWL